MLGKVVLLNSSAVSGERWAPLEGKYCILRKLLVQTKLETLCNESSLFWFVGWCCEGFMLSTEQLGRSLFSLASICRIVSWDSPHWQLWWAAGDQTHLLSRDSGLALKTLLQTVTGTTPVEKRTTNTLLLSQWGHSYALQNIRAGKKQLPWTPLNSTMCLDYSEENLPELCGVFYQIQTLLGSSELWFPQPLGNQLHSTAALSCSPSGTFLQSSVDSGISVLHKKLFYFSAIISLHKEKLGIFWKERRILRNSFR